MQNKLRLGCDPLENVTVGKNLTRVKHNPRKILILNIYKLNWEKFHIKEEWEKPILQRSEVAQEAESVVHQFFARPEVEQLVWHGGHPAIRVEDAFTDLRGEKLEKPNDLQDNFGFKIRLHEDMRAVDSEKNSFLPSILERPSW